MPVVCLAITLLGVTGLSAEDEPVEERSHHVHGDHEIHRNHIGVFLGVTEGGDEEGGGKEDTSATIALEYERRLTRLIGIGVVLDYVGGERRDHVGIIPLSFRPGRHARFVVGPGWERHAGTDGSGAEFEALVRIGFSYAIETVPGNSVSPEINVDFADGETLLIVGATIGWGF
jgi:hypothetical protein